MALLEIEDLSVRLPRHAAARPILDGVSLSVGRGQTVGLVGESGSGKSVACRSVLGLFPQGASVGGRVLVDGADVTSMDRRALLALRARKAAMVFQDPRASVNPLRRVGDFLTEALRAVGVARGVALKRAEGLLEEVGVRDPRGALGRYPHQFSGGMLQRVVIAAALAGDPELLLADEPTTALDVTTQAEVVGVLRRLQQAHGTGMLFVTHDLGLAAAICDRIYVMYAGRIVETRSAADLFAGPRHPYTAGLLASTPRMESREPPRPVPGRPVSLAEDPPGCAFAARCAFVQDRCVEQRPALVADGAGMTACLRSGEGIVVPASPDSRVVGAAGRAGRAESVPGEAGRLSSGSGPGDGGVR
jgi:oligopeptide/dipeptide ABC transporter ATP-binding protein